MSNSFYLSTLLFSKVIIICCSFLFFNASPGSRNPVNAFFWSLSNGAKLLPFLSTRIKKIFKVLLQHLQRRIL